MSQAPPAIANSGEDAILRTLDVAPEAFTDSLSEGAVSLEEAYEVDLTVREIEEGGYLRIGLQFADEQLHDSVQVFLALRDRLGKERELYILADTTYGSCCVDEVAAQHVDADFIVHYGHTCLSPTARLPVLYILTKRAISPSLAASSLASSALPSLLPPSSPPSADDPPPPKAVILLYDVAYAYRAAAVADELRRELEAGGYGGEVVLGRLGSERGEQRSGAAIAARAPEPVASTSTSAAPASPSLKGKERAHPSTVSEAAPEEEAQQEDDSDEPAAPPPPTTIPPSPSKYDLPAGVASVDECALMWLGGESLALNNVLLTHGRCMVWSFDPLTSLARLESSKTNRMLMRRYAAVEKAKDADVVGILVGTLGVAAYLPLITHLRSLIAAHRKKSYTVAVGKLNPAKLANFIEVECFVLVACPENSMVDSKEFLAPIVTPFELELALTSKAWTGDYILDFAQLLRSSEFGQDAGVVASETGATEAEGEGEQGEGQDEEQPVFSAATGKYRHPKRYNAGNGVADAADLASQASALSIRDQNSAVARVLGSAAGEYMTQRTYKGLDPRYGQDAPARLEMGREGGIARGYGYEKDAEEEDGGEWGKKE
ncbi:hypothetical protein JCM6882_007998 [Rhodosporidiobolus microsporus]